MNRTFLSIVGAIVVGVGLTYLTTMIPGPALEFEEESEPEFVEVADDLHLLRRSDTLGHEYSFGNVSTEALMLAGEDIDGDYTPLRVDRTGRLLVSFFGSAEPEVGRIRGKYESNFP